MKQATSALALAIGLDAALGEGSSRWHPVAILGSLLQTLYRPLERRSAGRQLWGGALALVAVAAMVGLVAQLVESGLKRRNVLGVALLGAALKSTFSLRQLLVEGVGVATALDRTDLPSARWRLRALVSRPTDQLEPGLLASAAIESLAENLSDSIVAPLLYYALFGLPGAAVYRVVNTADAMYGYHGETEWLGKAAARTDDLLNWIPSRVSAALLVLAAGTQGVSATAAAIKCWRHDAPGTASPNAGRPMAAMAGALRRRLEKRGHHVLAADQVQPSGVDVRRAALLTAVAAGLASMATLAFVESHRW